ncbi:hypothetical protein FPOAC2_02648 [Fusarium poae]|uniref:Uncharacterized protein n=1 Tax=Fusarium poae TaxID=36050 RepID=A0A1B8B6Y8_FUSPO|nr:hypothetical protein FPOAC1_002552 [Fusarium poae]KAG8676546.1 hypothetical protein FPOAC1_002552 [Fusarium poae]OBS28490.1 hypothetical protein FPOA_02426 [Fusarium poae]
MALSRQQLLSTFVPGINLYPGSSPASVIFRDTLYIFYAGSGSDGLWYTSTTDGVTWASIINVNKKGAGALNIAQGTSPAAVVFRDALYLFYNDAGGVVTYFTKFDGSNWSAVAKTDITNSSYRYVPKTSPSAAVYRDTLYNFYCASGGSEIFIHWNSFNGVKWNSSNWGTGTFVGGTQLRGVFAAPATSPNAVVFNNALYCFFNGAGNDGTWYAKLTGDSFATPVSVSNLNKGITFRPQTSPSPLVLLDGYVMRLYWVDNASQTMWYSDYRTDGDNWSPQKKLNCDGGIPNLAANTSITAVQFLKKPFIFWSSGSGINFCPSFVWEINTSTWVRPAHLLQDSDCFTVSTSDSTLVTLLRTKLGNGTTTGEIPFNYPRPGTVVSDFVKSVYSNIDVTDPTLATKILITTTLVANGFLLPYLVFLQLQQQGAILRFYRVRQ